MGLALTKRDRYLSSRSQLCGFRRALKVVLSRLVLLSSSRHIMLSLMKSRIMTWLAKLARHTTFAPQRLGLFSRDTIMRSRPFEFELVFLGNRGVINATGVVWGLQRLCHYVAHAPGPVFLVLDTNIALVYESRISRAAASTSEGLRLLLQLSLTVGLTSDTLACSCSLDRELKLNLNTLRLSRP